MVRDRHAHRLALLGVGDGLVHRTAREPDCTRRHGGACVVESAHCDLEAKALRTEHVGGGHDDILEGDAAGVRAALTHVNLLAADGDARRVGVHDEAREGRAGVLGRVRLREHEEPVGHTTISDPHLLTVEHPRVTLLDGGRLGARNVGARARFRHAVRRLQRRLRQPTEVLFLLLRGACQDDRRGGEAVGLHGGHDARAAVGELLADDHALEAAKTQA